MASYSPTSYSGTTGTFEYAIGWPYARSGAVKVYVDGVLDTDWYFSTSGTKIKWDTPDEPQTGESFVIKRVTDITDAAAVFTNGSGFTQTDINTLANQLLYSIDELQVPAYDSGWLSCATIVTGAVDIEYLHNLGALPTRVQIQYKCTSAEFGYEVGDMITDAQSIIGGGSFPVSTTAFTALFETINDLYVFSSLGVAEQATLASWSYRILAWR